MARPQELYDMTLVLLEESFVGSDKGGNVYLDTGTGWFPTLERLTAADASLRLTPGGTTAAGHVFHATFYLRVLTAELERQSLGRVDWRQSWVVAEVDEARWAELKDELRAAYEKVVRLLQAAEDWGETETDVAMAVITHSAYHLGAVRQFLSVVRGGR